jgi:RNA-directed DNA polymerase
MQKKKHPIMRRNGEFHGESYKGQSYNMVQTVKHNFNTTHNTLMDKVVGTNNIRRALKRVETNKGAGGVDAMTTVELREYLRQNWGVIKEQLLNGTYKPQPVRRVEIPKPDGGKRELGIPIALDRFIQQAILQILTPVFEPTFSDNSYGFRPGKSAKQAICKAKEYAQGGYRIVVDIDLEKFFDKVNHDILMSKIMKKVKDKHVLGLIRKYLKSGVMLGGVCVRTENGTPQGGPLSPLLSNIVLTAMDMELMRRRHKFVRYADDCNIYVKTARSGKRVYKSITAFIEKKLKLKVNEGKSAVDIIQKRDFLGFKLFVNKEVKIGIAKKTIQRFKACVRRLTNKRISISMKVRTEKLNEYLTGWSNYFRQAETKSRFEDLNSWIKRRLRACLLKQWKYGKTKLKMLVRLGLNEEWAGRIAFSRKKYWRLSTTPQIHKALGNKYWKQQGLVDIVKRYEEVRAL